MIIVGAQLQYMEMAGSIVPTVESFGSNCSGFRLR